MTPLMKAAKGGEEACVKLLLARGADKSLGKRVRPPCVLALPHTPLGWLLLGRLADASSFVATALGVNAASHARANGHDAIVKLLGE